jgi:hypothetical protein
MPQRRMAASGGLHESRAYQRAYFKYEISGNMSKHVQSPNCAILQTLYTPTLQL